MIRGRMVKDRLRQLNRSQRCIRLSQKDDYNPGNG
ncbi:rCG35091 [Rattus norvegicus]|uniref:RCG35091 n=1 Tax=Rattus norvegicus TaxID=10116 RepID=A6HFB0_RAT|nr:rCG35091 [Rattus norvegicus]